MSLLYFSFFFFNDTATTEIYTLSLHDALPICVFGGTPYKDYTYIFVGGRGGDSLDAQVRLARRRRAEDRKSTRLDSSHGYISYAVFCLKKKNRVREYNRG